MNIQTIPRSDKVVKAAFVPKLDAFLFADYPNIELKLLAFYLEAIGHPSMGDVFRNGRDLHIETAAGIYGVPYDDLAARFEAEEKEADLQRQVGKRLNFSIVYGGGVPTLIDQLGITREEALSLLRAYHNKWPGIGWESKRRDADPGTLIASIKARVNERGYITTLYGRHLHPRSMHSALNALCQGCAADLMKWAMVEVHLGLGGEIWLPEQAQTEGYQPAPMLMRGEGGFRSHIVNMVHDELMLDCALDEVPQLAVLVPEWMTDERIESVVPIKPSCEWSTTSWADKTSYQEAA